MSWKFDVRELGIRSVCEIQLGPRGDERGFFMRTYDTQIFKDIGLHKEWAQENHSFSKLKGTLRGLHFQYAPDCETKMMRAITGEMFFVIVDLRKGSPTFGKWTSLILSAEKKNVLVVPRGCANGMCTLTENCHLIYKVDNTYAPNNEDVIKWDDPDLAIIWPVVTPTVISERDANGKSFKEFVAKCGGIEP